MAAFATASTAAQRSYVVDKAHGRFQLQGFGHWKEFVNSHYPWLEHRNHSPSPFVAEVRSCRLGDCSLAVIQANAGEVIRTRQLAERSEAGFIKVMWQMAGQMHVEQDARTCVLERGQAAVCDTARPYRIRFSEDAHFSVLMLPHGALPGWESISSKICGAPVQEPALMNAALGTLLAVSGLEHADTSVTTVAQAVQLMLTTAMHRAAASPFGNTSNARINRAQKHILDHIGDPDLCADALAQALCMSRRSLYMLFKEYRTTPAKLIHDIRLQRCLEALSDVRNSHRKITDLAFDHGFNDYATFSRLFKAQYGLTPSEYRMRARGQCGPMRNDDLREAALQVPCVQ